MNDILAIETNKLAKYHAQYKVYESARAKLESSLVKNFQFKSIALTAFSNFALKVIISDPAPLYESGFFGAGSHGLLNAAYCETLIELRP